MTREEEIRLSRQGLLQSQSLSPSPSRSRRSHSSFSTRSEESAEGSDDDLGFEDKVPTPYRGGRRWPWVPSFQRVLSFGSSRTPSQQNPPSRAYDSRTTKVKRWCWTHKICLIITAILLGGLLTVLTGGALWVWKTSPKDGVCRARITYHYCSLTILYSFRHLGIPHRKGAHTRRGLPASRRHKL